MWDWLEDRYWNVFEQYESLRVHEERLATLFAETERERLFLKERVANLVEQKEAADRVLAVADQLAEWVRVTVKVEGVFSNNLGAQAQAQGLANLLTRYVATRESYPASAIGDERDPGRIYSGGRSNPARERP